MTTKSGSVRGCCDQVHKSLGAEDLGGAHKIGTGKCDCGEEGALYSHPTQSARAVCAQCYADDEAVYQ